MLFNAVVGFALATSAIAAPFTASGLNSTKWTPDHILQLDEVILYGENRSKCPLMTSGHKKSRLTWGLP